MKAPSASEGSDALRGRVAEELRDLETLKAPRPEQSAEGFRAEEVRGSEVRSSTAESPRS